MASSLVQAHILAEQHIRQLVKTGLSSIWNALPSLHKDSLDQWLTGSIPVVLSGQRASVATTNAYLARAMNRQPLSVDTTSLIGAAVRKGVTMEEVYTRPFVTVWGELSRSTPFESAAGIGLERALNMAAFDVQASMRDTAYQIGQADDQITAFQRVANGGACEFCSAIDGAILKTDDVMALHNNCGCSVEPLESYVKSTVTPPDVAIEEHGEMGPMLTNPNDNFSHG